MERVILHVDMNSFFASVACIGHPEWERVPMAVAGDKSKRHGIILAKNQLAKASGVVTGEPIGTAKSKCPSLLLVPPDMEQYTALSDAARRIYAEYTDRVESFGIDECWLDVTGNGFLYGTDYGEKIAQEIRSRIKSELRLTVSVGVSYNKLFAKMGSDYRKPDAVTVITPGNFKELLWGLPVENLLFVGRHTARRLWYARIYTIGDLATADPDMLQAPFGKNGLALWQSANGVDDSPVVPDSATQEIKSISNSTTLARDMTTSLQVEAVLAGLCERVACRLRKAEKRCSVVRLSVRTTDLHWYERQCRIEPTCLAPELLREAMKLFCVHHDGSPVRSIGVCGAELVSEQPVQLSLFPDAPDSMRRARREALACCMDRLHAQYDIPLHYAITTLQGKGNNP